jgi:1-acyl-sn-glycerol-3-phosphate acyltransferase
LRKLASAFVGVGLRIIIRIIARADTGEFKNVPAKGPLIIVFNHVNFLEVPLLYLRLRPRPVHYLAKSETWKLRFRGWMADNWGSVPVVRGGNPAPALNRTGELLARGHIILISPEGTRSETGILGPARSGAVLAALKNDAIILPVAHYGSENIRNNLRRLKRTRVVYRVGRPFRIVGERHPGSLERSRLTDAVMRELALILPEKYRGRYAEVPFNPDLLEYTI